MGGLEFIESSEQKKRSKKLFCGHFSRFQSFEKNRMSRMLENPFFNGGKCYLEQNKEYNFLWHDKQKSILQERKFKTLKGNVIDCVCKNVGKRKVQSLFVNKMFEELGTICPLFGGLR